MKKMKSDLNKKLLMYSAMAPGALFIQDKLQAQIIYTDVVPDTSLFYEGEEFQVDFNHDGFNDVLFDVEFDGFHAFDDFFLSTFIAHANLGHAGGIYHIIDPAENLIGPLADFDIINSATIFTYRQAFLDSFSDTDIWYDEICADPGCWFGENNYMGFKFKLSDGFHYGWVRLQYNTIVPPTHLLELVIKDYAYEATPGVGIFPGDMGAVCIPPVPVGSIVISPFAAKVKWNEVPEAVKYHIRYKPSASPTWSSKIVNAPAAEKKLTGLSCATPYDWQIRALCADGSATAYSELQNFITPACRVGETADESEGCSIYVGGNNCIIDLQMAIPDAIAELYAPSGQLLFTDHIDDTHTEFSLPEMPGIYLIVVRTAEEMYHHTVMSIK